MHNRRRSRFRALGALAVLAVGAAGLSACSSGAGASTVTPPSASAGAPSAVVSPSPSGSIIPGGPIQRPSPGSSAPAAHGIPVSGYSTNGTVLTVYYFAGVCDKYGVKADQSQPGEVRVTVVVTQHAPIGQMCPQVISSQHASVDLGRPLDGRKVIDTATGQPVPQSTGGPYSGMESHGPVGNQN
ncbi:hypothetical protein ABH931_005433 [Streptacidiphilus sp. MAP12-33]|uniref:hypothetical protein n=1 Tax=Streptacidiphilus sp. MAP12-33 TaxID=3156266 RepID=UPI0035189E28